MVCVYFKRKRTLCLINDFILTVVRGSLKKASIESRGEGFEKFDGIFLHIYSHLLKKFKLSRLGSKNARGSKNPKQIQIKFSI